MSTKDKRGVFAAALLCVLCLGAGKASAADEVSWLRLYGGEESAYLAVRWQLQEAGELGSISIDVAEGSSVDAVAVCPSEEGLPVLGSALQVGSIGTAAFTGTQVVVPVASIQLSAGDWWLVVTLDALEATETTRLGFTATESGPTVLCADGSPAWARVHGLQPRIQAQLTAPLWGKAAGMGAQPRHVAAYHGVSPNPTAVGSRFAFTMTSSGQVRARIFDVRGRLVREIGPSSFGPGDGFLSWDGRASNGATVSSGVYHVRIEGPGFSGESHVSIMR